MEILICHARKLDYLTGINENDIEIIYLISDICIRTKTDFFTPNDPPWLTDFVRRKIRIRKDKNTI